MKLSVRTLIGLILLAGGILAIAVGGFSYPAESHAADLGPVQVKIQKERHINIPLWAGVAAVAAGAVTLAVRPRK